MHGIWLFTVVGHTSCVWHVWCMLGYIMCTHVSNCCCWHVRSTFRCLETTSCKICAACTQKRNKRLNDGFGIPPLLLTTTARNPGSEAVWYVLGIVESNDKESIGKTLALLKCVISETVGSPRPSGDVPTSSPCNLSRTNLTPTWKNNLFFQEI